MNSMEGLGRKTPAAPLGALSSQGSWWSGVQIPPPEWIESCQL